jgi:hypothetical protein
MSIKLYLSFFLLAVSVTATAQIVTLKGKVINAKTGAAVPAASILSGSFGTSADGNGNFVFYVQQSVVEESGITISSIGYQTIHISDFSDNFNVTLKPDVQELAEVNIPLGAEFIVQKAFRQIPQNYINKSFNITGIQSMIHSVRDTFGYQYYYVNNAKVKIYMSAYADTPSVFQVGLMEKNDKLASNPKARRINFVNGYKLLLTHDDVHLKAYPLRGNPAQYSYKLNRKEMIDGRTTYVVNYYAKIKVGDAGILYIDSASCAFVRILFTKYNVKIASAIDQNKISVFIQYRKSGKRWAIDAAKYNSVTEAAGYAVERVDGFQVATINTENAAPLPADAIIQARENDSDVKPYSGFSTADKKMPKNIQQTADDRFQKNKVPEIADRVHPKQ